MQNNTQTPHRTLGISLAILLSILVYTGMPLLFVSFTLVLQSRFRNTNISVGTDDPLLLGGSTGFVSITTAEIIAWSLLAVIFLTIAILAWRGKPPLMRQVFVSAVIVVPALYTGLWFFRTYQDSRMSAASGGFASGNPFTGICSSAAILPTLVTLYVVWYMNRGPARAFYRGHYLDASEQPQRPE